MKSLLVFMHETIVGQLREGAQGELVFSYDRDWVKSGNGIALSFSLPLDRAVDPAAGNHFFANLLPEGRVRERICQRLKISADSDFALLSAIGGECAGALVIGDKAPPRRMTSDYHPLGEDQLRALMSGHAVFAALTGDDGLRLSLAGAQDKLPVMIDGDRYFLPHGNAPSTHILKFSQLDFKHLPANETFMTLLARELGLRTVAMKFRKLGRESLCEIERYDRVRDERGRVRRLHQEDFCQALGRGPRRKYEKEGGPNLAECFSVIREASVDPLEDSRQLWLWAVFNVIAGNSDAHGKNLAMLLEGSRTLAPFYDLVCTRAYDRLDRHLAMSIAGKFDPDLVGRVQWQGEAKRVDVKSAYVVQLVEAMTDRVLDSAATAAKSFTREYGNSPALDLVRARLKKNARTVRRLLV